MSVLHDGDNDVLLERLVRRKIKTIKALREAEVSEDVSEGAARRTVCVLGRALANPAFSICRRGVQQA